MRQYEELKNELVYLRKFKEEAVAVHNRQVKLLNEKTEALEKAREIIQNAPCDDPDETDSHARCKTCSWLARYADIDLLLGDDENDKTEKAVARD